MIPWAIITAFNGDYVLAISILVLWIIMSVTRQFIEPKIVSKQIGIHPIFTLIAMYTGFKFIGVLGMFIGPILLIILKDVFAGLIDKGVMKAIFEREWVYLMMKYFENINENWIPNDNFTKLNSNNIK